MPSFVQPVGKAGGVMRKVPLRILPQRPDGPPNVGYYRVLSPRGRPDDMLIIKVDEHVPVSREERSGHWGLKRKVEGNTKSSES